MKGGAGGSHVKDGASQINRKVGLPPQSHTIQSPTPLESSQASTDSSDHSSTRCELCRVE